MCAIGRDQITSVGAATGAATLLGSTSIGGSTGSGAKRIGGGISRTTLLGSGAGGMGDDGRPRTSGPGFVPGGATQYIP